MYYSPRQSGSLAAACAVSDLTDEEYRTTVLQPFGADAPVFLANNDWVAQDVDYFYGDWAEETLLQARESARAGT